MLDHVVAGSCERGGDPALAPLESICTGWSNNGKNYGLKELCLGGAVAQGFVYSFVFFNQFLKGKY